jgi:putative tricarboxylic transport membrane protein
MADQPQGTPFLGDNAQASGRCPASRQARREAGRGKPAWPQTTFAIVVRSLDMRFRHRRLPALARPAALVAVLVLGALASPSLAQGIPGPLRLIAPAAPGGGWDQTARVMQQVLQQSGLVGTVTVQNIPGAAGTIGLARFVGSERGRDDVLMVSGLIMLSAIVTNRSPVTLDDVTPIARLTAEYEALVVPASSPFQSLQDLMRAFREHPESISWGGGSAGGSDQILAGLIAKAVGVSPRRVNYIAFSGGGEAMSAILGGQVSVGVNGLGEFAPQIEAGTVRVLAVSSAERLPTLDAPTLREQGIDVEFENWRSLVAAPGITAAQRARLTELSAAMVQTDKWRDALARYRWMDRYLAGAAFEQFVEAEDARVRAVLADLGLGTDSTAAGTSSRIYPMLVLTGLTFLGVATLAGAVKNRTASMPVRTPASFAPLALAGAAAALDLLLIESAGFVLASTILCWLTARAFDRRRPIRDAVFAIAISMAAYLVFVRMLQVPLPRGVLPF